jgi:hypothetical protein
MALVRQCEIEAENQRVCARLAPIGIGRRLFREFLEKR